MKKPFRAVLAIILAVVILGGSVTTALLMRVQQDSVINDQTMNQTAQNESERHVLENDQIAAEFSPNVKLITSMEAAVVNAAIREVAYYNTGIRMQVAPGSKFDELGVGDIFYLEGSANTPLEQTYIGKIASVTANEGGASYHVVMPAIDEVFNELHLDTSSVLTADNANVVQALDGVTISTGGKNTHMNASASGQGVSVNTLSFTHTNANAQGIFTGDDFGDSEEAFYLEYEVDLFKLFGLKDEDDNEPEEYNPVDMEYIVVYVTKTGKCYHTEDCRHLGSNPIETTLAKAVDKSGKTYQACKTCDPPVPKEYEVEPELKLAGQIGLSEINFHAVCDWDILSGSGIENLYVETDGTFKAKATLTSSLELDLGEDETELRAGPVKLQGLDKKAFPIAYIGYNVYLTPVSATGNYQLNAVTSAVPATIGAMIYVDFSGKVSIVGTASIEYTRNFQADYVMFKDGQYINEVNAVPGEEDCVVELAVEAAFEMDTHLGASAMLHIFNVNIVELALVKIGAMTEGAASMSYKASLLNKNDPGEYETSGHLYFRAYLKLIELNVNISVSFKVFNASLFSFSASMSKPLYDLDLLVLGEQKPTRYEPGKMKNSFVTAQSGDLIFYKDLNGDLIMQKDVLRQTIYSEDFFIICGIDESYIYIMMPTLGSYSIQRIDYNERTERVIVSNVANCLMQDETYLYYTTSFDKSCIRRLNRETLKDEIFCKFEYDVESMSQQDNGLYVTTAENDILAVLFGNTYHRFLVNRKGEVIVEYDTTVTPFECQLRKVGKYYAAVATASAGYPRNSASAVYWISKDKSLAKEVEGVSGWNYADCGIFTVQSNGGTFQSDHSYKLMLYSAEDGIARPLFAVYNKNALFTLCKTNDGTWYYFDQHAGNIYLYSVDANFQNQQLIKTFDSSKVPFNLDECGVVLLNNTIYFYAMPNNSTCTLIDRYTVA